MTLLIRNSVFETNSSSCHSISISQDTIVIPKTNDIQELNMQNYVFGWDRINYTDTKSKLAYIVIYIRDWAMETKWDDEELVVISNIKALAFSAILYESVFEVTNRPSILLNGIELFDVITNWSDYENHPCREGYIDHQSVENSDLDYLFIDKTVLQQFIFCDKSKLRTNNDNY